MTALVTDSWGMLTVRGIAALAFGLIALLWPGLTLLVLIAFFAAYVIVSGIAELVSAYRHRHQRGWWLLLVLGALSIVAGVIAIAYPGITAVALVIVMGVTAITWGIIDIALAIRLRRVIRNEWLLALAGIVSILFGLLVLIFWEAGALALVWLIAVHAIALGILLIAFGYRVRSLTADGARRATA